MDLDALETQYKGRKFGELVLLQYKEFRKRPLEFFISAFQGTKEELPTVPGDFVEKWIDEIVILGIKEDFWRSDCGFVFHHICEKARNRLITVGIEVSPDIVFTMFQTALLNFVYTFFKNPSSKAFVQKSIGIGFLRRIFSK